MAEKKKNPDNTLSAPWFLLKWIIASFAMQLLFLGLVVIVVFPSFFLLGYYFWGLNLEPINANPDVLTFEESILDFVLMTQLGIIVGFSGGFSQRIVFQSMLKLTIPRWILFSSLGGFFAVTFLYILGGMGFDYEMLRLPAFLGILSLTQAWQLRKYTNDSALWVLSNFIGGLLIMVVLGYESANATIIWIFAVLFYGLTTGITILWLLQQIDFRKLKFESEKQHAKAKKRLSYEEERDNSLQDEYLGDTPIWDEA